VPVQFIPETIHRQIGDGPNIVRSVRCQNTPQGRNGHLMKRRAPELQFPGMEVFGRLGDQEIDS
jgi:hypothetical protein